jgi:amino acid adenylation domain-containing protein
MSIATPTAGLHAPDAFDGDEDGFSFPASFAQRRLWFLDQVDPGTPVYNVFGEYRLRGALDAAALERAWVELVARHEALRTVFADRGGEPVQVVSDVLPARVLARVDLGALPLAERAAGIERLAAAEAHTRFDLARGPLFRATLVRLADDEHALLVVLHHTVCDAWSVGLLLREMGALYAAFAAGEASPLEEPPLQYADFAAWQRELLEGPELAGQLAFWRESLAGAPSLLELPTDFPRPAVQSGEGDRAYLELDAALTERVRGVARALHATPYMVLMAAWQALLRRYSGQNDFVVGNHAAGRTRRELEGVFGLFVNTLAMRADLSGDPTFPELVARVREATLAAHPHQALPFEKLVEELGVERTLAHAPVFQVLFNYINVPSAAPSVGGLTIERTERALRTARVDLELGAAERGDRLALNLAYRTDLFTAATADRMLGHFRALLHRIADAPQARVSALELLDADERARVVVEWNDTAADHPPTPVHRLIAAQAARTPDAEAVVAEGERLTYAQLEARANRLARVLAARGAGPEARVAVCLERGAALIPALLAVLKTGAAYVPLDPAYPADRLAYMLEDAGAAVLLTQDALADALPAGNAAVVRVDGDRDQIDGADASAFDGGVEAENAAYVIYTSGSTGRPKGVVVRHGGLSNFLGSMRVQPGLDAGDTLLALTTLSFDIAALELYLPLTVGARVVVASRETAADGAALGRALAAHGATVLQATPATWRMLLDAGWRPAGGLKGLCGGEALPAALADALRERGVELWNLYGPTEVTVWATLARVEGGAIDIGRPIGNTRAYVLDEGFRPLPAGIPGELYLGGVQLARGYLGRPSLTAERFVPDPVGPEAGGRLYRTGDRARWRADGTLEYLGRVDFQVKVRGHRVELGEIESLLAAHDGVAQAVAAVREDRLVAYVTAAAGEAPSAAELRRHLEARLPAYMVPAAFVALERLPLTPNGKVDRRALPAPEFASAAREYVAPRTATETLLAEIWTSLLPVDRVGAEDDFFALGGHSLLATRMMARVREAFGVELPLRALFEAPTLAGLAWRVAGARGDQLPPVTPVAHDGPRRLSLAQERLWFLEQLDPGKPTYNVPAAVRLRGALDEDALGRALHEVVARHESLRTGFLHVDGEAAQLAFQAPEGVLATEDLTSLPEDARLSAARALAITQARTPFALESGRPFRAVLLRLAADDHVLLITVHHIVSDGWSMDVLSRDLTALYGAFAEGRPSPLAPLPVQYADYAAWQRRHLTDEVLNAQLAYWLRRMAGAPSLLELPTDFPRPAVQGHRGGLARASLDRETTAAVRALARRERATPFMVLLAAFQALLGKYSGQSDVVVGTPVAGRQRSEVEGLVGFFVNTLALRGDLSGDPTFSELVERAREATLGAHEHQDLPFERLVEALSPERSLSHNPVFQAVLTHAEEAAPALSLPGVAVEPLGVESGTAKFDLELGWRERHGQLHGSLLYATDLFRPETAERMLEHFRVLLQQAAADPDLPVSALSLVDADEARVLEAWNPAPVALPADVSTQALFEARVAATPDAVALSCGDERVTYDQLNRRANRIARALAAEGVGPEVVVPVLAERGIAYWVTVLGVMKAGGAFLPLDPNHPAKRWTQVLEQARVSIVLVQDSMECALREGTAELGEARPRLLTLHDVANRVDEDGDVPVRVEPRNLAYLIFTSGSTGRPKGAMLEHGGMFNHLHAKNLDLGITAHDRVGQNASQCFDISIWQFLSPLLVGATVEVMPDAVANDPALLVERMESAGVTVLETVPSLMQLMVEELRREREEPIRLESLRWLIPNGEVLPPELARTWLRMYPHAHIINAYGATETSDDVTHRKLLAPPAEDVRQIGIGGHLANARLHILDGRMQPVPAGVPGELYIAGVQVGRGYTFDPRRTASAFVPDPFGGEAGARMYRTGDRVRLRLDGELEFLGRVDHQVKLRGLRIELGEIEAVIRQHPAVRESVVLVREDVPGEQRLVGYVVAADDAGADPSILRAYLGERLPEYMVPAAFVVLEEMPLNANGKADRNALPAPVIEASAEARVAPRTPVEQTVADVWASVLGCGEVGVFDSFFALGGHSLHATRVAARLRAAFGVSVPLRSLFERPTVAALAAQVEALVMADLIAQLGEMDDDEAAGALLQEAGD